MITEPSAPIDGYSYQLQSGPRFGHHRLWRYLILRGEEVVMASSWRPYRSQVEARARRTIEIFAGTVELNLRDQRVRPQPQIAPNLDNLKKTGAI